MTTSQAAGLTGRVPLGTWPACILLAGGAFLVAYALGLIVQPSDQYVRFQADFAYLLPPIAALLLALKAIRASRRPQRYGFIGFSLLIATWLLADSMFTYYDLLSESAPPFPGITDILYYLGYAGFLVGVAFTIFPASRAWDSRWLLDTLVLSLSAVLLVGEYLIRPVLSQDSPVLSRFVLLGYPVQDLAILVLLLGAFYSTTGTRSRRALILMAAAALLIVTDLAYFYLVSGKGYEDTANPLALGYVLDLGYIGFYVLLATSFVLPDEVSFAVGPGKPNVLSSQLPLVAALGMAGMLVQTIFWGSDSAVIVFGATAVILLVLARLLVADKTNKEASLALTQQSGDFVFLIDSDTTILFAGPSVAESLGYSPHDLIGSKFARILAREDIGPFQLFLIGLVARPRPAFLVCRLIHSNSTSRTFRLTGNDRRQQPAVGGILIVGIDMTSDGSTQVALERLAS